MSPKLRNHLTGQGDGVTEIGALGISVIEWPGFLGDGLDEPMLETIRSGERTGRPLGDAGFVSRLEEMTGRELARRKRGPKPKAVEIQGDEV